MIIWLNLKVHFSCGFHNPHSCSHGHFTILSFRFHFFSLSSSLCLYSVDSELWSDIVAPFYLKKKTLFLTRSMSLVRSYTFKSSMSQIEGAKQSALLFIVSSLRHLNINKKEKSKKLSVFCFLRLLPSMNKRKINNWKKEKKSTFLL